MLFSNVRKSQEQMYDCMFVVRPNGKKLCIGSF